MRAQIQATTAAATSNPFRVEATESVGVKAYGLTGAETVKIQVDRGDGNFQDLLDASGTLTATAYQSTITASGTYRLVKTATDAASGASAG